MSLIDEAPAELQAGIREFWPAAEWDNAAAISQLESSWDAFADADTTSQYAPCGTPITARNGIAVVAEHSVGYFQVNVCDHPDWVWQRLWNARENAGTAHALWAARGWWPWYFSAIKLGLIP